MNSILLLQYPELDTLLFNLAIGFFIAGLLVVISYRVKFLTMSGAAATFFLAGFIFGLGEIKWSVPILTFFILSSLLSKIRKKVNPEIEEYFEKTGTRDHWQVLANGGFGGILVIINYLYPNNLYYYMYIASLAAVCADTWATEIGTFKKAKTYNIINLKPITQGVSGGISVPGMLGSFLGAAVISLSGILWVNINISDYLVIIIISGIGGSLFDSLLGATLQAQYYCKTCSKVTEKERHCNQPSSFHKGISWINNDIVNLLAGFAGIFIVFFYYSII